MGQPQQYLLEEGTSQVTLPDILGQGLHLQGLSNVGDEDYTVVTVGTNTSRVTAEINGRLVTYDF